jgi:hypothetical protein
MPPENPPTVADQLSMAYLTRHADQARQIIQETGRKRFDDPTPPGG